MYRRIALLAPLALGLALALPAAHAGDGADVAAATDEQKKTAQDHYMRGTKEFEAKRYEKAVSEFSASYSVVKSPNAHMMMARALLELGQAARAYNELSLVEQEARGQDRYASTLEKCRALRAEAAKKIAVLTIDITGDRGKPVLVTIDELPAPIGSAYGVSPGKAAVRAFRAAKMRDVEQLELKAGETRAITLDVGPADPEPTLPMPPPPPKVEAPPPPPKPVRVGGGGSAFVVAGSLVSVLGISGLAVGGGLYKLATDDYDELVAGCGEPPLEGTARCSAGVNAAGLKDSGEEKQTGAVAAFIAGGVVTAIGISLLIVGEALDKEASDRTQAYTVRIGPGTAVLEGRF